MSDAVSTDSERILGQTSELILLPDPEIHRELAAGMVRQARQSVRIFSWDLEPLVYDQSAFLDAIRNFATGGCAPASPALPSRAISKCSAELRQPRWADQKWQKS